MGFTKKTWKNRTAEYINRRLLTKEDGSTELVTVARDEGTISHEGDAFNAANMNDLEDRIEAGFTEINQSLTNENSETFNFGVKDGVRGFYTNPSRADDSFIPFKQFDNEEYIFDLTAYTTSVSNYSTTKIELPCKNYKLLSRTKLEESAVGTNEVIAYKNDGTKVTLSNDTSDLLNVDISDYVRLEASIIATYHYGRFKFILKLSN